MVVIKREGGRSKREIGKGEREREREGKREREREEREGKREGRGRVREGEKERDGGREACLFTVTNQDGATGPTFEEKVRPTVVPTHQTVPHFPLTQLKFTVLLK